MVNINDLISLLKEKNEWKELNLTKKEFKAYLEISMTDESKALVADAFRNNPCLEKLHSENKISQDEMKTIMKYAVNRLYFWFWLKENSNFLYNLRLKSNHLMFSNDWDDPDIDVENELQKKDIDEFAATLLINEIMNDKKKK